MKAITASAAVACFALLSYSGNQDYPFDLRDYYHPEFFQQGLVLTPSASLHNNQHLKSELEYSNAQGGMTSNYFYKNHRKTWQLSGNYYLYGTGYKTHSLDSTYYTSRELTYGSSYINIGLENSGRYYISGPVFIGGEVDLRNGYNRSHREEVTIGSSWDIMGPSYYYSPSFTSSREKSTNNSKDALVEFVFGYGGISDVTYPAVVMNMLDRIQSLQSKGVSATGNQIQDIASKVELLKRRRFLDFRANRIEVMDSLYNLFINEGVIDNQSVRITMELLDQWDYAFYQSRAAGKEVSIGPLLNYYERTYTNWSHQTYTHNSDEEYISYQPGLKLFAQYARPLGRFYQFSTRASAIISTQTYDNITSSYYSSVNQRESFPEAKLFYYAGLAWYPNTRTTIKGSMEASYYRAYDYTEKSFIPEYYNYGPDYQDIRRTQFGLGLSVDYYLSRNVSFQMYGGLNYADDYSSHLYSEAQKRVGYSLQSSMKYQVF